ncbi:ricin-type beta-trefoil lectin domain protein [Ceratobasidium sp. AG-Ba]|nr:ricin-type beta-trefoil lectin domain protein [Ceratobasidium sp. AG-Ba]
MTDKAKLNGAYTILSVKLGTAVDVYEGSNQNRTPIKCLDMNLNANQRWIFEEGPGGYMIKNAGTRTYIGYHTDDKPNIHDGKEVTCNANKVVYSIDGDLDNGVSISLVDQSLPFTLELDGEIVRFKKRDETPQPQQLWSLLPIRDYKSEDFKPVYKGPIDIDGVKRITRSDFNLDSNGDQGPHLWNHQTNKNQEWSIEPTVTGYLIKNNEKYVYVEGEAVKMHDIGTEFLFERVEGEEESYYIILALDPVKSWELAGQAKEGTRIDIKPGRHQKWSLGNYEL